MVFPLATSRRVWVGMILRDIIMICLLIIATVRQQRYMSQQSQMREVLERTHPVVVEQVKEDAKQ